METIYAWSILSAPPLSNTSALHTTRHGVAQDPFAVWFRQRAKDLLDGLDLTQISPESMSRLVFDGPSVDEDEDHLQDLEAMERLGMISP